MCGELLILGKSVIRHTQQRYCEFVHQKHRPARNRLAVVRHWPDKIRAWLLANAETLARVRFLTPVTMLASHRGERLARHLSGACLSANSMSMNPRRAAVLALVGWYLIAPQIVTPLGRKPYVDTYAPYWAWGVLHNFKSQTMRTGPKNRTNRRTERHPNQFFRPASRMVARKQSPDLLVSSVS